MSVTVYRWLQPVCAGCFAERNGGLMPPPPRAGDEWKVCCCCGAFTGSNITVRVDPETVPHPTPESD